MAGARRGARARQMRGMRERIVAAMEHLEGAGLGLEAVAEQYPQWFWKDIAKALLPKAVEASGGEGGPVRCGQSLSPRSEEILTALAGADQRGGTDDPQ